MPNSSAPSCVTAPERPNSRITASPITNGGVMIGSTVSTRSGRFARKSVRVAISAKARPRRVVPAPTRVARDSEVPATPHPTLPCRQPSPQILSSNSLARNTGGANLPSLSWSALARIWVTGKKMNAATSAMISPIEPTTNTSPLIAPLAAMPRGQQKQEGGADQQAAVTHAELAVVERAEQGLQGRELPAADADGKTLQEDVAEAGKPGGDQEGSERGVGPAPADQRERREQRQGDRREPPLAEEQRLQQGRRRIVIQRIILEQPRERPETAVDAVPRQDHVPDPADHEPQDDCPIEAHLPLTPTSRRKRPHPSVVTPDTMPACRPWRSSAGQRVHLVVPLLEQARALVRAAVLLEVVVDELDLLQIRGLRRRHRIRVRGHLVRLRLGGELLCLRGQRPVVPLPGALRIARALDDAHRADLVAGALAGRDDLDREALDDLRHHVVHECDA